MKQSTQKNNSLSLVAPLPAQPESLPQGKADELKDSFDGWMSSIAPKLMESPVIEKQEMPVRGRHSLSSVDVLRVNRATIRESSVPRHWPPDVVLSFLAAEVIKPTK